MPHREYTPAPIFVGESITLRPNVPKDGEPRGLRGDWVADALRELEARGEFKRVPAGECRFVPMPPEQVEDLRRTLAAVFGDTERGSVLWHDRPGDDPRPDHVVGGE